MLLSEGIEGFAEDVVVRPHRVKSFFYRLFRPPNAHQDKDSDAYRADINQSESDEVKIHFILLMVLGLASVMQRQIIVLYFKV